MDDARNSLFISLHISFYGRFSAVDRFNYSKISQVYNPFFGIFQLKIITKKKKRFHAVLQKVILNLNNLKRYFGRFRTLNT